VNALLSRADAAPAAVPALRDAVARATRRYLSDRGECEADSLYALMLSEMETALLSEVMKHCDGNQSRAAAVLGINRATLRKKLEAVGLLR
jgi:Fis family transcriptional regulator